MRPLVRSLVEQRALCVGGHRAPRLHGRVAVPVLHVATGDHATRRSEDPLDIAPRGRIVKCKVGTELVPQHGRVGCLGAGHVDHGGQRLVGDLDQRRGVVRDGFRLGDDHRYRVAHQPHLGGGQRVERCDLHVRGNHDDDGPGHHLREILGSEHRDHTRQGARRAGIDGHESRVRLRAAHERNVTHADARDTRGEATLPAQQALVFDAFDRLACETTGHGTRPSRTRRRRRRCGW
ncbi:unannotated protein [freshwater metagenome]